MTCGDMRGFRSLRDWKRVGVARSKLHLYWSYIKLFPGNAGPQLDGIS